MWWKTTEESLPPGAKLLSIILYSDATTTDTLEKKPTTSNLRVNR
jgi:hypothetical protein